VNTGASWPDAREAEARVLRIQTKLHRWATDDPGRQFFDLYNLVCDPAFLAVAWKRVKSNRGARSAGVDGQTAYHVTAVRGEEAFLAELRGDLKSRTFRPLPVRERMIPKRDGKSRRLGIGRRLHTAPPVGIAHIDEGFDFLVATRGRTARVSSLTGGSDM
jgi:RNA-directed DNA polymerase